MNKGAAGGALVGNNPYIVSIVINRKPGEAEHAMEGWLVENSKQL